MQNLHYIFVHMSVYYIHLFSADFRKQPLSTDVHISYRNYIISNPYKTRHINTLTNKRNIYTIQ